MALHLGRLRLGGQRARAERGVLGRRVGPLVLFIAGTLNRPRRRLLGRECSPHPSTRVALRWSVRALSMMGNRRRERTIVCELLCVGESV